MEQLIDDPRYSRLCQNLDTCIIKRSYINLLGPRQSGLHALLNRYIEAKGDDHLFLKFNGKSLQRFPKTLFGKMAILALEQASLKDYENKARYQEIQKAVDVRSIQDFWNPELLTYAVKEIAKLNKKKNKRIICVFTRIQSYERTAHKEHDNLSRLLKSLRAWHEQHEKDSSKRDILVILAGAFEVERQTQETSPYNVGKSVPVEHFSIEETQKIFQNPILSKKIFDETKGLPIQVFGLKKQIKSPDDFSTVFNDLLIEDWGALLHRSLSFFSSDANMLDLAEQLITSSDGFVPVKSIPNRVTREKARMVSLIRIQDKRITFVNPIMSNFIKKSWNSVNLMNWAASIPGNLSKDWAHKISRGMTDDKWFKFIKLKLEADHAVNMINSNLTEISEGNKSRMINCAQFLSQCIEIISKTFGLNVCFYFYDYKDSVFKQINRNKDDEKNVPLLHLKGIHKYLQRICRHRPHTLFELPEAFEELIHGTILQNKNRHNIRVFPFKTYEDEGINRFFGLLLIEVGPFIEFETVLTGIFQKLRYKLQRFYQNRLMTEMAEFMSENLWMDKPSFFKDFSIFIMELFNASNVFLNTPGIQQQANETRVNYFHTGHSIPYTESCILEQKILEGATQDVYNLPHVEDFPGVVTGWPAFEHLKIDMNRRQGQLPWPTLAFSLKRPNGRTVGSAIVMVEQPFPDSRVIFSPFHEHQARVLGNYCGQVLEKIQDRELVTSYVANTFHNLHTEFHKIYTPNGIEKQYATNFQKQLKKSGDTLKLKLLSLLRPNKIETVNPEDVIKEFLNKGNIYPNLNIQISPCKGQIRVSPNILGTVIRNILNNADERLQRVDKASNNIAIEFLPDEDQSKTITIRYRDYLGGFSPQILRDFPDCTSSSQNGMGMGMPLIFILIEQMGGQLELSNWKWGAEIRLIYKTNNQDCS